MKNFFLQTIKTVDKDKTTVYAYQHPIIVRLSHWFNAVALLVLIMSGLEIFSAFPSFGEKVPQENLVNIPMVFRMGGWLGGAIQWHFTFMWVFIITGLVYLSFCLTTGYWKQVFFLKKDINGLLPMLKHYFLFRPKPEPTQAYNALQKLAYTITIGLGLIAVLTGFLLYKPVQLGVFVFLLGGFQSVRFFHFVTMCGFLFFIAGHFIMVVLHGWNNFLSIIIGWRKNPDYINLTKT